MSAKTDYSTNAEKVRMEAQSNEEAARSWAKAREEHDRIIDKLDSVSINDYAMPGFSVTAENIKGRKMVIPSRVPGVDVVADFAGGYMRLQIHGTRVFLDKDFKPVRARTAKAYQLATHFRIMKLEEMI